MKIWKRMNKPFYELPIVEAWALIDGLAIALYSDGRVWVSHDHYSRGKLEQQLDQDRRWQRVVL